MKVRCCDFIELFFKIFRVNNVLKKRLFSGLKTGVESTLHFHTLFSLTSHLHTRATPIQSQNQSLRQKSVSSTQIRHFHTNPSVSHISVSYIKVTSLRQVTSTKALYKRALQFSDLRGSDDFLLSRRVKVTDSCGIDGFVLNCRICVKLSDLCRTVGFVLNCRIFAELMCGTHDCWGLKRSAPCDEVTC